MHRNFDNASMFRCTQQNSCKKCYDDREALPKVVSDAMAYIPFQVNTDMFEECVALKKGTLYPVLDKPFFGGGNR